MIEVEKSYSQCRFCGQFHNSTARDCRGEIVTLTFHSAPIRSYRVVNGKLFQTVTPGYQQLTRPCTQKFP